MKREAKQRTMPEWAAEMSKLYDELEADEKTEKKAAEMANICGKALKAEQLELAKQIYLTQVTKVVDKVLEMDPSVRLVIGDKKG